MSAQSCALLPAQNVEKASRRALISLMDDREQEREKIKQDFIKVWRRDHKFQSLVTKDCQIDVPEYLTWIANEYRSQEEKVLKALNDLASIAGSYGAVLTLEVTADDFRLISRFYNAEEGNL